MESKLSIIETRQQQQEKKRKERTDLVAREEIVLWLLDDRSDKVESVSDPHASVICCADHSDVPQ